MNPLATISRTAAEWLVLVAALCAAAVYLAVEAIETRRSVLATEEVRLTTLSRVVAKQITRHIEGADHALRSAAGRFPALVKQKDGIRQMTEHLRTLADAMPGMRVMMVVGADGNVVASTLPEMVGRNFGDRNYFKAAKDRQDSSPLYISPPFRNSQGAWTTLLIRTISGPNNSFGGIVFVSMEPREIADMLAALRYAPDMWAAVGHAGGKLFVVSPEGGDLATLDTRKDPDSLMNRHLASGRDFTLQRGIATAFGVEVMMAQRDIRPPGPRSDDYLIVAVARRFPEMLSPWRRDAAYRATMLAIIALVAAGSLSFAQRRRRVSAIREAEDEQRFRQIFDANNDAILLVDAGSRRVLDVNRRMTEMYRISRERALDTHFAELMATDSPAARDIMADRIGPAMPADPQIFECQSRRADGEVFWCETTLRKALIGGRALVLATVRDTSERRRVDTELRIAAAAFDSTEGMMVADANGIVLRVNKAFTEISGYRPEDIVGRSPSVLKSGRHDAAFYADMWASIHATGSWQGEIWDRHKDGHVYPKWLTISAVHDADGTVTHYVGSHIDISERKLAEERINALAFYDQLTGLPNRTLLADRLGRAMAQGERSASHGALLLIDLDNFKTLNDTEGHEMGDLLLKEVARRLQSCIRAEDTAARQGGDEFVVVLAGLGPEQVDAARATELVADKILTALSRRYELGRVTHSCSASIGATLFRGMETSAAELMKQADLAMYKAKATGRNASRFFDAGMEVFVQQRAALEAELRTAVENGQFLLLYQPQVTHDGRITGAEVLIRWPHPQRGMVSPADFIPLAEDTGLIVPMGCWVLRAACATLVEWAKDPRLAHLAIAVNVSARQFHQVEFVTQVMDIVRNSGAPAEHLKLELTESLLAADVGQIVEKMYALKEHGIGFSLDDFGTGYSSLSYLKRLPIDQLKIDQSFVRDVLTDPNDAAIAQTVVALGNSLGLAVIAEGVETQAQQEFLLRSGCLAYQGYYYSKPLVREAFESYVLAHGVKEPSPGPG